MIKKIFLIPLFCFLAGSAFGQANDIADQGSIYSKFGLGRPIVYGSPSAEGMGLWGVSFIEPNVPGVSNPAQWGSIVYAVATGGIGLTTYYAEDNFGSARHSFLHVNHFQLVLPLYKGELGLSAAFMPYSNTSFKLTESGRRIIAPGDTVNYFTQHFGNGGVNKFQLGIGWRINNNISIGYAAALVFASVDNNFTTIFEQNDSFNTVGYTLQTSGTGFGHRFGVYLNFPSLFGSEDQISLGASFTMPVKIDAESKRDPLFATRTENGGLETEEVLDTGSIQLPMGIIGGITYQPIPKLSFTVEGLYQDWSIYRNTLDPDPENLLVDRYKIGAGLRYFPFLTGSDKFLSTFKYRLGVSYDIGHLKLKGHRIETLMFSFGLGYITPLTNLANSSIDLSFHYGIRGTKVDNLVQQNIWKVKLSVNLAELFFYRPKIR